MEDKPQPLQVDIDEPVAREIYTNLALIAHSETEFIFDFLFLQPQSTKTKVLTRLVTSPVHAKRLMWALRENLEKYEARFGPVNAGESPEPPRSGVYQ